MIGLSVDDGPVADPDASPRLYDYLKAQNQKISHFMIGANIRDNPEVFLRAFTELENDIGAHTWSHPYMTTLTNEQVVAELGWTMQIIHDSTGGRIPRYWRPPFGDADNRVRAIAETVFGLTSVIWNRDTVDFGLSTGVSTLEGIQELFTEWLAGPRSPGLIILEHEIEGGDVTAFMNALPLIRQNTQWTAVSVAQLFENQPNGTWYLNAQNNTSPVTPMILGGNVSSVPALNAQPNATNATTPLTNATVTDGAAPTNTNSVNATANVDAVSPAPTDATNAYNPPATVARVISTSTQLTTGTPSANNVAAAAVRNAAGATVGAPSHLALSLVAILSVLGGSTLL